MECHPTIGAIMTRSLLVLLMAIPLSVGAQVYKSVDENGNAVFSDRPPANKPAEKIQLGTINSTPPPPPVTRPEPVVEEEKTEISVEIVSPLPETAIAIGYAGNFAVEARINPSLAPGSFAQLLMDGTAIGGPQPHSSWQLNNTFPGSHILTVVVTDGSGERLAVSPPITVHILRAAVGR